jgi:phage-related protein (TIGR01555 family)
MGRVLQLFDRLTNVMSGKGTSADRSTWSRYTFIACDPVQAEAAYRTSWLVRKIVDIPPFDMTREGRDWQAEAQSIETIEAEERRLQLWPKLQRALILSRLYGGGAILLGTKDADPTQPLQPERVAKGGLAYIHVLSRHQLGEGGQQRLDPADPWFGQPEYFSLMQTSGREQVKIHPSRIISFIGQRAPEGSLLPSMSWFWGDPIMQSIGQAVKNADLAQDGFAALIDEAKIDILKVPDLINITATDEGSQRFLTRLQAAAMGKSTWRTLAIDAQEEWQQKQISWTGMPDMVVTYLNAVAGAADIPLTRLLGVSPKGLQSNGDGEERDYHAMVRARQNEQLAPALDRIDDLLIRSALGTKPSDVYYEFAPLRQMDEKDAAEIEAKYATGLKSRSDTGMFQEEVLAKAELNRMVESGRYPGIETAIADADNEGVSDPTEEDPSQTLEQRVATMEGNGTVTPQDAIRLIRDASPRSLYVSRKLLNGAEFIKWAKGQGFETTVPADELHVTVLFSRSPVDWMAMGSPWSEDDKGQLKVPPGGARLVEPLGDKGAVVLLFNSSALSWRHEEMVRNGASHDFDSYQPHVTISYAGSDLDLSKVEPFRGELVFGPEIFTEVVEDWEQSLTES